MATLDAPGLPPHALVVLVGPDAGATAALAATWPAGEVVSPTALRAAIGGGRDGTAAAEAFEILCRLVEGRVARRVGTVVDGAGMDRRARQRLLAVAVRHRVPGVLVHAGPADGAKFRAEGFERVVDADDLRRLEPYLRGLSRSREAALGLDGRPDELRLPRRFFGPEILPLWRWTGGRTPEGARLAEIRLGAQGLTLAVREGAVRDGDVAVDVRMPCPVVAGCAFPAWGPVFSVGCLHRALANGPEADDGDTVCTVHGSGTDTGPRAGAPTPGGPRGRRAEEPVRA